MNASFPLADTMSTTPLAAPVDYAAIRATAAAITPADRLLEHSAGAGLLAVLVELAGGSLSQPTVTIDGHSEGFHDADPFRHLCCR